MGRIGTREAIVHPTDEEKAYIKTTLQCRRPLSMLEINRMAPTEEVRARKGRP
jgi:hypothetical protein